MSEINASKVVQLYSHNCRRNFVGIQLSKGDFSYQNLSGIDFSGADLQGTNFTGATLRGAKFAQAQMVTTSFRGADIRGATFVDANLKKTDFTQATAGIRPVLKVILSCVLILLAIISGVAHGHASGITFSDTPLVSSLSTVAYQHYFLVPRSVMLSALAIFATVSIWNGIGNSMAAIALTVTGIFLVATVVALVFFKDTLWNVVDYALWGVAGSMAWATFGTVTLAINATMLSVLGSTILIPLAVLVAGLGTLGLSIIEPDFLTSWQHPEAWGVAFFLNGLGGYLAWRAYQAQPHFRWMRRLAVFIITAIDSTNFSRANLSEADFTGATLGLVKLTDQVCLQQTGFYQAKKLEHARLHDTYLNDPIVRKLLVEKRVEREQFCQFDSLNLQGVNLQEATLIGGSFVGTDFSHANLQGADLSQANLTRVQLDSALLTGATLTGATIEGWSITHRTQLHGVACEHVFMKWVNPGDADQNPLRKPDSYREIFKEGEFVDFIQPLFTTLDLYHTQDVDPRAIAISYKHLEESYPEAQLDIVAIEKRGRQKEQVLLRVETTQGSDLSELSDTYLETYNQLRQLPKNSLLLLVAEQNFQINLLTQRIQSMLGQVKKATASSDTTPKRLSNLVVFTFTHGDLNQGFSMSVLIWPHQSQLPEIVTSHLPPAAAVNEAYHNWSQLYRAIYSDSSRISFSTEANEIRNISLLELENCALQLVQTFNHWLRSDAFLKISDKLREKFTASDEIRIVVQTKSAEVCCLPWQSWNFTESYPKVEFAFGQSFTNLSSRPTSARKQRRILAVLGNSKGIDIRADQALLEELSNPAIEVIFLHEPTRQEFHDVLRDAQGWDILYFAGHSETGHGKGYEIPSGTIQLNAFDHLQFSELRFALTKAVDQGLQLAIFNSCDGVGLAQQLETLQIPQVVVMKELVPDPIARLFLQNFLKAFAVGEPLQIALREARQQLECVQDRFPYASWLPLLFQNSAEEPGVW